jgi:hypothetical protein
MCQQAFNACMILLLDANEFGILGHEQIILEVQGVFLGLQHHKVHRIAELASMRISQGLQHIAAIKSQLGLQENEAFPGQYLSVNIAHEMPAPAFSEPVMNAHASMILLEDLGSQSYAPAAFRPLNWTRSENKYNLQSSASTADFPAALPLANLAMDLDPSLAATAAMPMTDVRPDARSSLEGAAVPSSMTDRGYPIPSRNETVAIMGNIVQTQVKAARPKCSNGIVWDCTGFQDMQ